MSSQPPPIPLDLSSSAPSYEAIMRTARTQLQQRDLGSYEEIPLYFAWERLYAAANANCSTDWLDESHEAFQRRTQGRPMARQGLPPPPPAASLKSRSASADHLKRQSAMASSFLRSSTLSPSEMSSLTKTYRENATKMKALRASHSSPGLARGASIDRLSTRRSHRTNALIHELELEAELDSHVRKIKAKKKRVKAKRIYESSSSENDDQPAVSIAAQATSRDAKSTPIVAPANLMKDTQDLSSTRRESKAAMSWDIDLANPANSKTIPSAVEPIAVWSMHNQQSVQDMMPAKAVASDQVRQAEETTQIQYPNDIFKQTGKEKSSLNGQIYFKSKTLDVTQDSSLLSEDSDEPLSPIPVVGSSTRGSLRMSNSFFGSESIESPSNFSSDESTRSRHSSRQSQRLLHEEELPYNNKHAPSRKSSQSISQSAAVRSQRRDERFVDSESTEHRRSTYSASQTSGHHINDMEEFNKAALHQRGSRAESLHDPESLHDQTVSGNGLVTANEDHASLRKSTRMSQRSTLNSNNRRDFSEEGEYKEEEPRRSTQSASQSDFACVQPVETYTEMRGTTKTATLQDSSQASMIYSDEEDYEAPVRHRSTNAPILIQANNSSKELLDETPLSHRSSALSQSLHANQEPYPSEGEDEIVNPRRPTELTSNRQRSVNESAVNSAIDVDEATTNHELQFQRILTRPTADRHSIHSIEIRGGETIRRSSRSSARTAPRQPSDFERSVKDEEVSGPTRVASKVSLAMQRDRAELNDVNSASFSIQTERKESREEERLEQCERPPSRNLATPMSATGLEHRDGDSSGDRSSRKAAPWQSSRQDQDFNRTNMDVQDQALRSSGTSEKQTRRESYRDHYDEMEQTQSVRSSASNPPQRTRSRESNANEPSLDHRIRRSTSHSITPAKNEMEFDDSSGIRRFTRTVNETPNVNMQDESAQHHNQHRTSQRRPSSHRTVEDSSNGKRSTPMNKIFGQSQESEQWSSDESELRTSRSSTPAFASTSTERHARALKQQPSIVWPPGMEGGMKGLPSSHHHPCAPPGMEHLVTDEQLSEYWTWLHWYSSWQIWYLKNERKPNRRTGSSRKHSSHKPQQPKEYSG